MSNDIRIGAVIVFQKNVGTMEAKKILDQLVEAGKIELTRLNQYEEKYGGPVWYVP